MRNAVMLLEKILRGKLSEKDSAKYRIRVHVTQSGNLPNRAPFIRQVYRQTTLDEFMDDGIGDIRSTAGPLEIVYTVHGRYMQEDEISNIHDMLIKDLDEYLFKKRMG
jgi:hypothetical protein